jgi:hypothetical protein
MEIEEMEKDYIGDGVYTLYDGYGIWLHANDHRCPTDRIYLEPSVLRSLIRFANRVGMQEKLG